MISTRNMLNQFTLVQSVRCSATHMYVTSTFSQMISLLFIGFTLTQVQGWIDVPEVIIDTDPGADDAMAILMMLADSSKAKVLAITTVTGNSGVINTTRNARLILKVANESGIPVYSGSEQGLTYRAKPDFYFGYDGLGDIFLKPENVTWATKHAAEALARIVSHNPGRVTILCIGPLTNIALALHMNPDFLQQAKDVIILGGSYKGSGNMKSGVEFNFFADPEAAAMVLSRSSDNNPVTLLPLETLNTVTFTADWRRNVLGKLDTCFMDFLNKAERVTLPKYVSWVPYDQTAAAVVLEPRLIVSVEEAYLEVETCGRLARGACFRNELTTLSNTRVITGLNKTLLQLMLISYMNSTRGICL